MLKRTIVVVLVIGLCSIAIWHWFPRMICDTDTTSTAITHSKWIVLTRVDRCSAVDGTVTVSAMNTLTKNEVEIVFVDEENVPSVKVLNDKKIQLEFDNLVDIVRSKNSFDGIAVEYNFLPRNDPKARERYQFWAHHPNDPQAIKWSREHFRTSD